MAIAISEKLQEALRVDKSSCSVADMSTDEDVNAPEARRVLAANLLRLRNQRGYSLRELSAVLEQIGRPINPDGLNRVEKGGRNVTSDELIALAIVLGVTPNRLLLPDEDRRARVALAPTVVVEQDQAWGWADGTTLPLQITRALNPEGRGRDFFAAQEDFARAARPAAERVHSGTTVSRTAADVQMRIRALIGWMAEFEQEQRAAGRVEPSYDYLGFSIEALELATARLQADLAELMSNARRLRAETTPAGTPLPPLADDDGDR